MSLLNKFSSSKAIVRALTDKQTDKQTHLKRYLPAHASGNKIKLSRTFKFHLKIELFSRNMETVAMTRQFFLLLGATSAILLIVLITLTTNKSVSLNSKGVSLYYEALCGQLLCRVVSLVVR